MPNVNGIKNADWQVYRTSVRQIEQNIGLNLLSNLPQNIQDAVFTPEKDRTPGQVLLAKLAVLVVLAAVGRHNWKRVKPSLGTTESTARLHRSTQLELGVGLLVIIVTAILVATPTPMMPGQ